MAISTLGGDHGGSEVPFSFISGGDYGGPEVVILSLGGDYGGSEVATLTFVCFVCDYVGSEEVLAVTTVGPIWRFEILAVSTAGLR